MMTVELGISVNVLWHILFPIQFFFTWHRLTSHMAYCWTLHQLKGKRLWLTLENTKLCLWAGSGWKCSWQMEIVMSFLFHCSTGRRHFLHRAIYIKVYSLRGKNIPLLISCSIFPTGNGFQTRHSALNGTWGNRNPFPSLASRFKNQTAPSFTEQNPWPEQSPAPWAWNPHMEYPHPRYLLSSVMPEIQQNSWEWTGGRHLEEWALAYFFSYAISKNSDVFLLTFFEVLRTIWTIRSKSSSILSNLALWTRREMRKDSPDYFTRK